MHQHGGTADEGDIMTALNQILFMISYAIIALAIAVLAPAVVPGLSPATAGLIGLALFVAAAQLHQVYLRRLDRDAVRRDLFELHRDQEETLRELESRHHDIDALREEIEAGVTRKNAELVSEVKVLQTLLAQVVARSERSIRSPADALAAAQAFARGGTRENAPGKDKKAAAKPPLDTSVIDDAEALEIMRNALDDNRVDLYLQPIVSLPQRRLRYFEAYSRVRDSDGQIIYPRQYVPLAEQTGLIGTLDNLLLYRCIQVLRDQRGDERNVLIFVNISSATVTDRQFFPQFIDFMQNNPDLAGRLVFELAQHDVLGADEAVEHNLRELAALGFQFSLDHVETLDFDYPALGRRRFRFIKTPAPLLLAERNDIRGADMKKVLRRSRLELIVEKIEDERTLVNLLDYDVDFGQGFLFGEPKPSRIALGRHAGPS
jgi:cyclic-di-GMP phosphodiesterase TipF (flagellum assembly factor)